MVFRWRPWKWLTPSLVVSVMAMVATGVNAYYASRAFKTNRESQAINLKTMMFSQFQQEYASVSSRFPRQYLNPTFHPKRGTEEYGHLEAYWIFCFAEWYATKRIDPKHYGALWDTYYSPLIMDATEIPSLRSVLVDMIQSYRLDRGDWRAFFAEIGLLARRAGHPLDAETEQFLKSPSRSDVSPLAPPGTPDLGDKQGAVLEPPDSSGRRISDESGDKPRL